MKMIQGQNEKVLFVNALSQLHWTVLYKMQTCQKQFHFFDAAIANLIDTYFPMKETTYHTKYKP